MRTDPRIRIQIAETEKLIEYFSHVMKLLLAERNVLKKKLSKRRSLLYR